MELSISLLSGSWTIQSYFEGFPKHALQANEWFARQSRGEEQSLAWSTQLCSPSLRLRLDGRAITKSRNRHIGQWWGRGKRLDPSLISSMNATYLSPLLQTGVQHLRHKPGLPATADREIHRQIFGRGMWPDCHPPSTHTTPHIISTSPSTINCGVDTIPDFLCFRSLRNHYARSQIFKVGPHYCRRPPSH